jgi:hypothetical protein
MSDKTDTPRVLMTEGSIELPAGFEDRTTNIFKPENTETTPNLSVARDWLKDGETLADYVGRQLGLLKKQLPTHKLLDRGEDHLGEGDGALAGERIDAQYKTGARMVYQRQAVFLVGPLRAIIFTASSPKPLDDRFDILWHTWLRSFRLHAAPGEPAGSGPESATDGEEP